jgi:hypothetical protein
MPPLVYSWILKDLADLSTPLCGGLFAIGLILFLLGGYGHRFWLVLGTTLAAGIIGLQYGRDFGMQPLVAGLFLGVSVGALALALIRIAVFVGVGAVTAYLVSRLAPGWNEQLACFLVGGLIGVVFFRVWIMVLSSLFGSVLMTYSALLFLQRFAGMDVASLAERNAPLFNWSICGLTLLGLVFQTLLLRRGGGEEKSSAEEKPKKEKPKKEKKREPELIEEESEPVRGWFSFPFFGRKAS